MNDFDLNPYIVGCGQMSIGSNPVPGIRFGYRVIRWFELELIVDSKEGYIINVDHRIEARRGRIMIRKPGTVVSGISSYGCKSVSFDSTFDERLSDYYEERMYDSATVGLLEVMKEKSCPYLDALPEMADVLDFDYAVSLFDQLLEVYLEKGPLYHLKSKKILFELLELVARTVAEEQSISAVTAGKGSHEVIQMTKRYMESHFNDEVTLEDLSRMAGYSREAYSRLFRKSIDISPIEYLIRQRILWSKHQLITTANPIYQIALAAGFKNDTYFYTAFKKREGMSPGQFRDMHQR